MARALQQCRVALTCAWHPNAASQAELLSEPGCFVRVNGFICRSANSLPVINRGLLLGAAEEAALLPAQEEGTG